MTILEKTEVTRLEAKQVTKDNLYEVAGWTNGSVVDDSVHGIPGTAGGIISMTAHIGDWVVSCGQGLFFVRDDEWIRAEYEIYEEER